MPDNPIPEARRKAAEARTAAARFQQPAPGAQPADPAEAIAVAQKRLDDAHAAALAATDPAIAARQAQLADQAAREVIRLARAAGFPRADQPAP